MDNVKHNPTHPGAEHPPMMTCEIPLEEYESIKKENERLKIWMMQHFYCEEVIACESAKNRKLQRALWLARAAFCARSCEYLSSISCHCKIGQEELYKKCELRKEKYLKAFRKCRAKAEEYK